MLFHDIVSKITNVDILSSKKEDIYSNIDESVSIIVPIRAICDSGFVEIDGMCFNSDDMAVLQEFIDNSYESGIDLDCEESDPSCGSPNPYMDSPDAWFSNIIDGQEYIKVCGYCPENFPWLHNPEGNWMDQNVKITRQQ